MSCRYSATHNPGFLYVASELLKVFGKEPQHAELLGEPFRPELLLQLVAATPIAKTF